MGELNVSKDEVREIMAMLLLEEGENGLDTLPVVKIEEPEVTLNLETRQADHRKSAEPMSNQFEEKIDKVISSDKADHKETKREKTPQINPSERVDGHTFLGQILQGLGGRDDPDPDDSSDSDGDGRKPHKVPNSNKPARRNDHSTGEGQTDAEETEDERPRKMRGTYSALRPPQPAKYDGEADAHKFFKFVSQSAAYCKKGRIHEEDQVQEISYFLEGDAYKFYLNEVSLEEHKWDLSRFMKGLFNYSFPPNYRQREREKLEQFKQGQLRVRSYAAELKNKYQIIGYAHKKEKVRKLWAGLQPRLQQKLYENGFDPEKSQWGEIVDAAETYEIAREMGFSGSTHDSGDRPNDRGGNGSRRNGTGRGNGGTHRNSGNNGRSNGDGRSEKEHTYVRPQNNTNRQKYRPTFTRTNQVPRVTNSNARNKPNRLTETEVARYKAEGLCFKCGGKGHRSNECPDDDKVKSSGSGPPGVRSNNIHLSFNDIENLRDSGSTGLRTSSACIQVAAIRFGNVHVEKVPSGRPKWRRTERNRKKRRLTIKRNLADLPMLSCEDIGLENPELEETAGDPYAKLAMYMLESQQPYPGDYNHEPISEGSRFLVYRISEESYILYPVGRCKHGKFRDLG
ncbi:hypothetical protein H0H93_008773 [Arthromyces matolae]|nr:hypothetical protein H0H93_008773 [Arthromyces matolae]